MLIGSVAGSGPGDVVDRLHEGLDTANTLIRSFGVDDEAVAALEYGAALHRRSRRDPRRRRDLIGSGMIHLGPDLLRGCISLG